MMLQAEHLESYNTLEREENTMPHAA